MEVTNTNQGDPMGPPDFFVQDQRRLWVAIIHYV